MINENRLTYYNSLSSLEYHAFSFSLFTISFFANVRWYLKNPRVWLVSDVWLDSRKQVWIYCIILALYQKPHQPQYLEWTLHLPSQTQIILPYVWPFIFTNDKKKVLFPSESHSVQHLWAISVQRTMLDVFFFGFLDQFLPPTHALIKEIIHEYLLYILGMSGLPLPSQWVAKPGTVCVCVCLHLCACSVAQSCPTLWGPMDCSLPSSWAHGIFQVRILKQGAISYSMGSSRSRDPTHISCDSCIGETPKEEHQIYHSIWLNNSFNCFFTRSYLCWWERADLQVDFEGHFNTRRKLIIIKYLWKLISLCGFRVFKCSYS